MMIHDDDDGEEGNDNLITKYHSKVTNSLVLYEHFWTCPSKEPLGWLAVFSVNTLLSLQVWY